MASRHRVGLKLDLRLIMFLGKEKGDVEDLVLCSYIDIALYPGSFWPEKPGKPGYKASYHCAA